jgi:hypothetical protein
MTMKSFDVACDPSSNPIVKCAEKQLTGRMRYKKHCRIPESFGPQSKRRFYRLRGRNLFALFPQKSTTRLLESCEPLWLDDLSSDTLEKELDVLAKQ